MTTLHTGDLLDHYRIEKLVARSGMASIYKASDERDGKPVAIKIPHPEMEGDPLFSERFHRESDIGKKLNHPAVMKVYPDDGQSRVYMAMEWVDGRLLRQILAAEKKMPVERAVRITIGILRALEYIHKNGVVHRDLKPENVMVDSEDRIKLIDFGIAGSAGARRLTFAKLTETFGTPDYISPEQVRSKRGDGRSDLYAAGVMLYEMLTGKVPFTGPNAFLIMNDRLLNNPTPPREHDPSITPQLQEIIYRALERDPGKRYATAHEFIHDLEHQDEVGVADRPEMRDWRQKRSPWVGKILLYVALALIPIGIFTLMYFIAKHAK